MCRSSHRIIKRQFWLHLDHFVLCFECVVLCLWSVTVWGHYTHTLSLSLSHTHTHTHTHTLSLPLPPLSVSFSLSHTHTHTHTHIVQVSCHDALHQQHYEMWSIVHLLLQCQVTCTVCCSKSGNIFEVRTCFLELSGVCMHKLKI